MNKKLQEEAEKLFKPLTERLDKIEQLLLHMKETLEKELKS